MWNSCPFYCKVVLYTLDANNGDKQVSSAQSFQLAVRNPCDTAWLWLHFFPKMTRTFRHVALFILAKSLCAILEEDTIILLKIKERAQVQGKMSIY